MIVTRTSAAEVPVTPNANRGLQLGSRGVEPMRCQIENMRAIEPDADRNDEVLQAWPLGSVDAKHVADAKALYRAHSVRTYPSQTAFDVDTTVGKLGLISYYRAVLPLSDADINMRDPESMGFLHKEVSSMALLLRNYKLKRIKQPLERHLAAALIVHEFHHYVLHLASFETPVEACFREISQRIGLINAFIQYSDINMNHYRDWLNVMMQVKSLLYQILDVGPIYEAQQKVQTQLLNLKNKIASTVPKLMTYQYYVLKTERGDFTYDPLATLPLDLSTIKNTREALMLWVLLEENVSAVCGHPAPERHECVAKLPGVDVLDKLPLDYNWKDPDGTQKLLLQQIEDNRERTGLPAVKLMSDTKMDAGQHGSVIQLWLSLHRELIGLARGAQLMEHAYTLSCLGGDLLMARQTSKELAISAFTFVSNRLLAVQKLICELDSLLLNMLAGGKLNDSYFWGKQMFLDWSENFKYAQSHCSQGILDNAAVMLSALGTLEQTVCDLQVEDVDRKISQSGHAFIQLASESFSIFKQEHTFVADPLIELKTPKISVNFEQSTASTRNGSLMEAPASFFEGVAGTARSSSFSWGKSFTDLGKSACIEREISCVSAGQPLITTGHFLGVGSSVGSLISSRGPSAKYKITATLGKTGVKEEKITFFRMVGLADIADLFFLGSGCEPVEAISLTDLKSTCSNEKVIGLMLRVFEDQGTQKVKRDGVIRTKRIGNLMNEVMREIGQCIPPGHAPVLIRQISIDANIVESQRIDALSLGISQGREVAGREQAGIVTMCKLTLEICLKGACAFCQQVNWDAELSVLKLQSLSELFAHLVKNAETSQQKDLNDSLLKEEIAQLISSSMSCMQLRFNPANYPEIKEFTEKGYVVTDVHTDLVNANDGCVVC